MLTFAAEFELSPRELAVTFALLQSFEAEFALSPAQVDAAFEQITVVEKLVPVEPPTYSGDYEVTPANAAQRLATKQKFLNDDVRAHSAPYRATPPQGGGMEVTTGG